MPITATLTQAAAWQEIRQAWIDILGHEPTDLRPEDNYYYNLLISGQQPIEAIRQGLYDTAEYKARRDNVWNQIKQAWLDILGHLPNETIPEQNYYFQLLISKQQPIEAIRTGLTQSAEYIAKHTPEWNGLITGIYQIDFHVIPTTDQRTYWHNRINNEGYNNIQDLMNRSANTIFKLYQEVFNREPDPAGGILHFELLAKGELTEDQIKSAFLGSDEMKQRIAGLYKTILLRDASEQDLLSWFPEVASGRMTFEQVQSAIINSEESINLQIKTQYPERYNLVVSEINDTFQKYVNRSATNDEISYWTIQLLANNKTIDDIILDIQSGEDNINKLLNLIAGDNDEIVKILGVHLYYIAKKFNQYLVTEDVKSYESQVGYAMFLAIRIAQKNYLQSVIDYLNKSENKIMIDFTGNSMTIVTNSLKESWNQSEITILTQYIKNRKGRGLTYYFASSEKLEFEGIIASVKGIDDAPSFEVIDIKKSDFTDYLKNNQVPVASLTVSEWKSETKFYNKTGEDYYTKIKDLPNTAVYMTNYFWKVINDILASGQASSGGFQDYVHGNWADNKLLDMSLFDVWFMAFKQEGFNEAEPLRMSAILLDTSNKRTNWNRYNDYWNKERGKHLAEASLGVWKYRGRLPMDYIFYSEKQFIDAYPEEQLREFNMPSGEVIMQSIAYIVFYMWIKKRREDLQKQRDDLIRDALTAVVVVVAGVLTGGFALAWQGISAAGTAVGGAVSSAAGWIAGTAPTLKNVANAVDSAKKVADLVTPPKQPPATGDGTTTTPITAGTGVVEAGMFGNLWIWLILASIFGTIALIFEKRK